MDSCSVLVLEHSRREDIAATAATSAAKYIQALFMTCGQHVNIHLRSDSTGATGVGRSATPPSSGRAISVAKRF